MENIAVATQQQRAQAIELDLLGVVLARQHRFQVHLHPCFRGAPAEKAEGVARELGFGQEGGQPGEQQHGHGPRRELRQQHAVADQRDAVLGQAEGACHQRQRPARGLAPRPGQLVVELRILEVRQLQGQRLFQDHHVHALAQLRPQQRLAQRDAALRAGHGHHKHGFERDQPEHRRHRHRIARRDRAAGRDDGIDDQRTDVGDARRQQAADQGQQAQPERQAPAGAPHQFQRPPAETEYAEEASGEITALGC